MLEPRATLSITSASAVLRGANLYLTGGLSAAAPYSRSTYSAPTGLETTKVQRFESLVDLQTPLFFSLLPWLNQLITHNVTASKSLQCRIDGTSLSSPVTRETLLLLIIPLRC